MTERVWLSFGFVRLGHFDHRQVDPGTSVVCGRYSPLYQSRQRPQIANRMRRSGRETPVFGSQVTTQSINLSSIKHLLNSVLLLILENREWLWLWFLRWSACPCLWPPFWLIFRCLYCLAYSSTWARLRWPTCNSTIDCCSSSCPLNTNRIIFIFVKWLSAASICSPSSSCFVSLFCGPSKRSTPFPSLSPWW